MTTKPTAAQEAAARDLCRPIADVIMYGTSEKLGFMETKTIFPSTIHEAYVPVVAALIAERDAARAERDALVIKTKPVSHLVRLERESDPGFAAPGVPQRVMDNSGLYWSVAAPPGPAPAKTGAQ